MSQPGVMLPDDFSSAFFREIKARIRSEYFSTWFTRARVLDVDSHALVIAVESVFLRDWIQRRYFGILEEASKAVDGIDRRIRFSVVASPPESPTIDSNPIQPKEPKTTAAAHVAKVSGTPLNPNLCFDNFVVGLSNNLPHAAARAVAKQPGTAYNPLFLHGSVGLGKTHLLQAICHNIIQGGEENYQNIHRIQYISCETFVNQFITAIQGGDLNTFRNRYRNPDMLIIDDIHLLAHKERSQEEFFHTFNHLVNSGKQVVFSSDSPPHEIPTLQERLVSRFKSGLVGELELPDLETRVAIVDHKARIRGIIFPSDVSVFIAEQVKTNIRELEGAVIEVIGYSALNDGKEITLELALKALKPVVSMAMTHASISMQDIFSLVNSVFGVTLKELQSKKRTHTVSLARHICMYLGRTYTRHSLLEIGGYLGGKDHSSVLYAINKIKSLIQKDPSFKDTIDKLVLKLKGGLL